MASDTSLLGKRVRITWTAPDSDWHEFTVLDVTPRNLRLKGEDQRVFGTWAKHDGKPFWVKWIEVKTLTIKHKNK